MPTTLTRLMLLCSIVFPIALWADQPPVAVNSAIMGVYFDLDRYEAKLRTLEPEQASTIRGLTRGVAMTSVRLEAAPNQDDPSWKHAADRLDKIKQALAKFDVKPQEMPRRPPMQDYPPALPPLLSSGQRADLDRLSRDMDALSADLQALDVEELQRPEADRRWHDRLRRMQSELSAFPGGMFNPDVAEVQSRLDQSWAVLEQKRARAMELWRAVPERR